MSNRKTYDHELTELDAALSAMGRGAAQAVHTAYALLDAPDAEAAQKVIDGDKKIDELEQEIEHQCLELLLRQQPIAGDLRRVSTALKLVTDLERIGDHAADLAEISRMLKPGWQARIPVKQELDKMALAAQEMIQDAMAAFLIADMVSAKMVSARDDEVDTLFDAIKHRLAVYIAANPEDIDAALDLLMVIKYFERLGDHAVNIAEWTLFLKTGFYRGCWIV
jgi:phosphate transport system protein